MTTAPARPSTQTDSARNTTDIPVLRIPVDAITPSPLNPRRRFDEEALAELAQSITAHGLLEPIVVRPSEVDAEAYLLVAGERRWRATRLAGQETIVARLLPPMDDRTALELALVENLQRQDLDPIEEAEGYRSLHRTIGLKQAAIAAAVNRSQPAIANAMRLLELPETVQEHVREKRLTRAHGIALVKYAPWPKLCTAIAELAIKEGYTSKRLEKGLGNSYNGGIETSSFVSKGVLARIDDGLPGSASVQGPSTDTLTRAGITVLETGSYRVTPDVEEYGKQAKALKREDSKARSAVQRQLRDRLKAGEEVDLGQLDRDRFTELPKDRPAGCGPDCACLAKGTWYGRTAEVCTNPTRFRELTKADAERQAQDRLARIEHESAEMGAALAAIECPAPGRLAHRALALVVAGAIGHPDRPTLRTVLKPYGQINPEDLSFSSSYMFGASEGQTLDLLATLPATDLLRIAAGYLLRCEIRDHHNFSYYRNHGTPQKDWLLANSPAPIEDDKTTPPAPGSPGAIENAMVEDLIEERRAIREDLAAGYIEGARVTLLTLCRQYGILEEWEQIGDPVLLEFATDLEVREDVPAQTKLAVRTSIDVLRAADEGVA